MINGKSVLSIITARAGSKGIVGKNFKKINGLPLVCWSMLSSMKSKYVDATVVSSNCTHVKKAYDSITEKLRNGKLDQLVYNSSIYFLQRPDEFATDTCKNEEALIHACDYWKKVYEFDADIIVNLQPTSPIRSDGLIDLCLSKFDLDKADSLFTGTRHTPFYFKIVDGKVKAEWDINNRPMRQELKNESAWLWHDDGSVYIVSTPLLLSSRCRLGGKMSIFELTHSQSLQIDTQEDFDIVEFVMKQIGYNE